MTIKIFLPSHYCNVTIWNDKQNYNFFILYFTIIFSICIFGLPYAEVKFNLMLN